MTIAYCPHCQAKLSYGDKTNFCANCGQTLKKYNLPIRNRVQTSAISVAIAALLLILGIVVAIFLSNS